VIQIDLPPLRVRGSDVLLLARQFLQQFATQADKGAVTLSPGAAARLLSYAWPGNVRELQNCVERAVALCRFSEITVEDLPERIRAQPSARAVTAGDGGGDLESMDEVERRHVLTVFEATGG
jgi:two-component system response regulator HydG